MERNTARRAHVQPGVVSGRPRGRSSASWYGGISAGVSPNENVRKPSERLSARTAATEARTGKIDAFGRPEEVFVPEISAAVAAAPEESNVVVAGPGTGKSFRLQERAASLEFQGISRREMVVLTLTNETVKHLRKDMPDPAAMTVHSFALSKLNALGIASRKRIADRWEQAELVRADMKMLAAAAGYTVDVRTIDKFFTKLGAGFRDTMAARPTLTGVEAVLELAWQRVREFLSLRLMDELAFDLRGALDAAGHALPYPPRAILVDEYQDLTPEELRLIRTISNRTGAGVFAAGDDRQSIYGFREADPLGLNSFAGVYGTPGPVFMSLSRRCPGRVVALAEEVAGAMPTVPGLTGRPGLTSTDPAGGEVRALSFRSPSSECAWVVRDIDRRLGASAASEVAIIVPRDIKFYFRELEDAARAAHLDLTFIDPRGHPEVAEYRGVRLAYALLRLAEDAEDELAWRAALHLARGVGASKIKDLYDTGSDRLSVALRARAVVDITLQRAVDAVAASTTAITEAANEAGLRAAVDAAVTGLAPNLGVDWGEVLVAIDVDPAVPREGTACDIALDDLRKLAGAAVTDREWGPREVGVHTIFGAKGQQWNDVYVIGAYEQGFTDRVATADGLRLLYVALTRSKGSLTVSFPRVVRYTQLAQLVGATSTTLLPQFMRACRAAGVMIEVNPAGP
jgi:superfamily I DNA/RNA helicase